MKSFKILYFLLLFSAVKATAQYGYGNGNYINSQGPGVIRNMTGQNQQQKPSEPTPAEIEKNRVATIDNYMARLRVDLSLDELQYIAIKNEINSGSKKMDIVAKSQYSDDEKNQEIKSIQESMEKTINSYLNPSQREKYELLKTHKPEKKEDRKRKKDKEKEEKPKE